MQKIKLDCDACGAPLKEIDRPGLCKCPNCGWSYAEKEDLRTDSEQRQGQTLKAKSVKPPEMKVDRRTSPVSENLKEKISALLANGMKIQAIKPYRDETGADLKNAKHFVESIKGRMR
jgi:ribosomal protein L7/L12